MFSSFWSGTAACVVAGAICAPSAWATCNPDDGGCEGYNPGEGGGGVYVHTEHLVPVPALALISEATQNAQGSWDYLYTLKRTGSEGFVPLYVDKVFLPYFGDMGITGLASTLVSYARNVGISTSGGPGNTPAIVSDDGDWFWYYEDMLAMPEQIRFTSPFAPGAKGLAQVMIGAQHTFGGYETHAYVPSPDAWLSFEVTLPGSPQAIAASIPEPESLVLTAAGLLLVGAVMSRKRRCLRAG